MNAYQTEQRDALRMVRDRLAAMATSENEQLRAGIADYLDFRSRVAAFLDRHFSHICTEKCYNNRLSACCSKDGIIAFFGDVVVNALVSDHSHLDHLDRAIQQPEVENKCIFLSGSGCLWTIKPIVCEMFLCDEAEQRVFDGNAEAEQQWEGFKAEKKHFTWPDKVVLFEWLESCFMKKGCASPLMYIHHSPGLLRVKNSRPG